MRVPWNEDMRVKFPATVQFMRLGYEYQSLKDADIHPETKIFLNRFVPAIQRINRDKNLTVEQILATIEEIHGIIKNNDMGKEFLGRLLDQTADIKLIDFDHPEDNDFAVVDELTFGPEAKGSFRPDVTVLVNGIPLGFLEVKKPNNEGGIQKEFHRMLDERLQVPEFKKYFNMLQFVTFSNNMEYETDNDAAPAEEVRAGSFYSTPNGNRTFFSFFREENPKTSGFKEIYMDEVRYILKDNGYSPSYADTEEFQTNLQPSTPCNRFVTSFFDIPRMMYLLQYGFFYVDTIDEKTGQPVTQKHIMRYPQFFASQAILKRIDGGGKSGIIFHTQGSGKTELSAFSTRIIRDYYSERGITAKFYYVVDRLDLLIQVRDEMRNRGLNAIEVNSRSDFEKELKRPLPKRGDLRSNGEIVVVNIQKFTDALPQVSNVYDAKIQRIFFVDEAHRSYKQTGQFFKNLMLVDDNAIYKNPKTGKVYQYGYIVDFVDIEKEYDRTIEMYLKEMEDDFNDDSDEHFSLAGLVIGPEDIDKKYHAYQAHMNTLVDTSVNLELFSQQLVKLDRDTLLAIRRDLNGIKDCRTEFLLSRAMTLAAQIDEDRIKKLLREVQNRIDFLNLTTKPIDLMTVVSNEEVVKIVYEFFKVKISIMDMSKLTKAFKDVSDIDGYEDTIQYLINHVEQADFYKQFDDALVRIAQNTRNDIFAVETAEGSYRPLFEPISTPVEPSNRNNFAKNIFGIIAQDKFDFSSAFAGSFDFYSTIFEYLIKDYNVASGVYAEYFTPQAVSSIIARCLVGMSDKVEASEISDPAAGSGSLVLHLAHELGQENGLNRAIVYTQDISSKSTRFLRLNMMLNGMTESLGHIIQGDTLLNPAHFQIEHEPTSGLKKYAYQTANPPFKLDFSSTRDAIEQKWSETDRFFAGVPKIPASKKESMAIYLLFIQHIMYCMKDNGKAAIVVPTGFLTAKSKIEYAIRQRMVDKHIIKGVISMPSNIFANTGTNVSILFLDNANAQEEAFLVDASSLGKKVKDGKNQRTVLSDEEVNCIIDVFTNRKVEDDFSVSVPYDEMTEKNYSFSAGQYFEVKIEHIDITPEEFQSKMDDYKARLSERFVEGHELEKNILRQLNEVFYEG